MKLFESVEMLIFSCRIEMPNRKVTYLISPAHYNYEETRGLLVVLLSYDDFSIDFMLNLNYNLS